MIFPAWIPGDVSGGLLIALIAVIHVFVAQFAIGGGLFLVMAERMALKDRSQELFDWVQGHSSFFLLLSMVFGALTGVAIWLVISVVSPAGSRLLVHEFYFFWAAEWVFFLCEIIALILYTRHFSSVREGRMSPATHMGLGLFYAFFAFLSLVAINGIITFMLTPGEWLVSKNPWDGFFNPSFWPALTFRSFLCLLLAGLFGLVTTSRLTDAMLRHKAVRMCAQWIIVPALGLAVSSYWYTTSLPVELQEAIARRTADMRPFVRSFIDTLPLVFFGGLLLLIRMPRAATQGITVVMLLLGLIVSGSFEWMRETGRRPWLVYGYMYSNGITPEQGAHMTAHGFLATSPWASMAVAQADAKSQGSSAVPADKGSTPVLASHSPMRAVQAESTSVAGQQLHGKLLFAYQCSSCHGINAPQIDIIPRVQQRGLAGLAAQFSGQGIISPYMPPIFGNAADKNVLVQWLALQAGLLQPENTSALTRSEE